MKTAMLSFHPFQLVRIRIWIQEAKTLQIQRIRILSTDNKPGEWGGGVDKLSNNFRSFAKFQFIIYLLYDILQ